MLQCVNCGHLNPDGAGRCHTCGTNPMVREDGGGPSADFAGSDVVRAVVVLGVIFGVIALAVATAA